MKKRKIKALNPVILPKAFTGKELQEAKKNASLAGMSLSCYLAWIKRTEAENK